MFGRIYIKLSGVKVEGFIAKIKKCGACFHVRTSRENMNLFNLKEGSKVKIIPIEEVKDAINDEK